jgi:hypothetical protein
MSYRPKTVAARGAPFVTTAWATWNAGTATRPSLRRYLFALLRLCGP